MGTLKPDQVFAQLKRYQDELQGAKRLYVGYSGGLDSHVLLHALVSCYPRSTITAIHVNHGLSEQADDWQAHCQSVCNDLQIPLVCRRVEIVKQGKDATASLEAAARRARYRQFETLLGADDVLLLAHHMTDQAETVLFRLLRGAGVKGLSAMSDRRNVGAAKALRPLLSLTRSVLQSYADVNQLQWVEDSSNQNVQYDRNFIRHQIMPLMTQRWPQSETVIARAADHCREAQYLVDQLARSDLATMAVQAVFDKPWLANVIASLSLDKLLLLDDIRVKNVLRYWINSCASRLPSTEQLNSIVKTCCTQAAGAAPFITFAGIECRSYQGRLYLLRSLPSIDPTLTVNSDGCQSIDLPGNGRLAFSRTLGEGIKFGAGQQLEICYRSGGERCCPEGRAHSQKLKKLLQEYGVEPWVRHRIPVLYVDGVIASVIGLWHCSGHTVSSGEEGLSIHWDCPKYHVKNDCPDGSQANMI